MPTYDYVCAACGHRYEVIHGVHEHGPSECPNCHARALRKAIVSPTVLYKGSGWAKKDRGSSARTKAAAKADSTESGSSSSTESGSSPSTGTGGWSSTSTADPGSGSSGSSDSGPGSSSGSGSSTGSGAPSAASASSEGD